MMRINFSTLEANVELVKSLFGNSFYTNSMYDTLTVSEVLEANKVLLEFQIGKECAQLIHQRDVTSINARMWINLEQYSIPLRMNDDSNNIGIVVVRPEAQWFEDDIIKWLEKHDIQVIEYYKSSIDFWMHWYLYFAGFEGIFEDRLDFPTRILNYDNQMLHVMMVKFKNNKNANGEILKFLANKKGVSGLYQQDSIRSEVCYISFQKIIENSGKSFKQQYRVILDPIGMYRKIARGELWCDNDNKKSNQIVTFYTGLSVHIPDEKEAQKHKKIFRIKSF